MSCVAGIGNDPIRSRQTSIHIRNMTVPGRYADGNGLYLVIDPAGTKRWVLRTLDGDYALLKPVARRRFQPDLESGFGHRFNRHHCRKRNARHSAYLAHTGDLSARPLRAFVGDYRKPLDPEHPVRSQRPVTDIPPRRDDLCTQSSASLESGFC